jgi:UDP-glucose 4-epimerase
VVAIFSERAMHGRPLIVYGDGEQTRDYVYVKDVAKANLIASTLELEVTGTLDDYAFNVGTGIETSVNDLVGQIVEISGHAEVERQEARAGELLRSSLDVRKLKSTGWSPEYGLAEGLSETYAWVAAEEGCA